METNTQARYKVIEKFKAGLGYKNIALGMSQRTEQ